MFNTVSRLYFTTGALAASLGLGYGIVVGDRVGFAVMVFAGVALVALGVAVFGFSPREPLPSSPGGDEAEARPVDTTDGPGTSLWPVAAAAGLGVVAVGVATETSLVTVGVLVGVAAALAWFGQAWSEHPSWTPAMTERLHDRFVVPIGLPGTIVVLVGIGVISLAKLMLALSRDAAPVVGIIIAFAILGAFQLVATRPPGRTALTSLVVVSAGLVLASGVVGAVMGERDFAHHGEEQAVELVAEDVAFDREEIDLPAATKVKVDFVNHDTVQHNFALYTDEGGEPLFQGEIIGSGDIVYEFEAPEAGNYYFQCDVHPAQMNGRAHVAEPASEGGHAPEPPSEGGHDPKPAGTTPTTVR